MKIGDNERVGQARVRATSLKSRFNDFATERIA